MHLWWLYCSTELIVKGSHPTTHKVSLKVSQASCYFHHLSQYILRETNWFFRVSGCNSYIEFLLNYIMRHHHETPTNRGHGITFWPWGTTTQPTWNYVLTSEAPPRDLTKRFMELYPDQWGTTTKLSWNYVLTTPTSCSIDQYNIIAHTNSMSLL